MYKVALRQFQVFVGRDVREVAPAHIIAWRDELLSKFKPATVAQKLSIIRSFYTYLNLAGYCDRNPADPRLVSPPLAEDESRARALSAKEVNYLLAGPDQNTPAGARDFAILLCLLRLGMRRAELCRLKKSDIGQQKGKWTLRIKVKGGRERTIPLPADLKQAIDHYLQLDGERRSLVHSDGDDAFIFQPLINNRTGLFARPLDPSMVYRIVRRWAEYGGIGRSKPHDMRHTAVTTALDLGASYREVQAMTGHKDPKTIRKYDRNRENLETNAINRLRYDFTR